jgi:predicted GTPase
LEWAPPYDWRQGARPKEENIRAAVAAIHEQLGDRVGAVVPVCTAAGKVFGIEEGLLPALMERLDEAHGVALLRCLRGEVDTGKVRRVFYQLLDVARAAVQIAWRQLTQNPPPPRP